MSKYPWQGFSVKIHPLFWLVVCSAVWTGHFIELMTLFVLVVIHELGHITAAWSYGWRIRKMEILPYGGVAEVDEWGNVSAREEIVVALAGPFQHVWLIIMSLLFMYSGLWDQQWTAYFIQANLVLISFNLLPIYPLDGGKVLQAVFSYFLPYQKCILYTLWFSIISACFIWISLLWILSTPYAFNGIVLMSFLIFSNIVALKQRRYQFIRFLLSRLNQKSVLKQKRKALTVYEDDGLWHTMTGWYKGKYHVIRILDPTGNVVGQITEEMILKHYFEYGHYHSDVNELLS
ncbi:M50 family metallopeptidase [Hazenella sp. IB182357]|uniref:M50 family metallopeptidase n=1 Tax=Polycladospora coralii TaxID=2771432 RepID=A0A926RTZ8_9BACL|nr:M50 family metallopeptidase [Polycladospora coralii]MBD1371774.1 M50 family metallopeptidase [Polycladospora coralii]MBS7529235.1 M50 family metallopeptidase [Polycladospora coralii]